MGYDFSGFNPRAHGNQGNAMGQKDIDHLRSKGATDYEIADYIRNFGGTVGQKARDLEKRNTTAPQQAQASTPQPSAEAFPGNSNNDNSSSWYSSGNSGSGNQNVDQGKFGFNDIMNQFYSYKPDKDDAAGNAMKNSFAANMVQSGFNNHMAKDMAEHQTGLSQDTMTHAADLELRNTSTLMKQEHGFNMATMGAASEYQNQFADREVGRDVTRMGAAGEQQRETIKATGTQNQMQSIVQGEQDRLSDTNRYSVAGKENRATDTNKIIEQGSQDRELVTTKGKVDIALEKTKGYQQRKTIGTTGEETRKTRETEGRETRKGYETQGSQARQTMSHGADIELKKSDEQHRRSNVAARSF